jgi:hypothetical protein
MRISRNTFITSNFTVEFAVGDTDYVATFKPVVDEDWYLGDRYDVRLFLSEYDNYDIGSISVEIYEKIWDEKLKCYLFDSERVINSDLKNSINIMITKQ